MSLHNEEIVPMGDLKVFSQSHRSVFVLTSFEEAAWNTKQGHISDSL